MSRIPKTNKTDLLLRRKTKSSSIGQLLNWKTTRSDKEKLLRMSHNYKRNQLVLVQPGKSWKKRTKLPAERKALKVPKMWKRKTFYHSQKKIGKWTIFFAVREVFIRKGELSFSLLYVSVESWKHLQSASNWDGENSLKVPKFADKKIKSFFFSVKGKKKVRRNEMKIEKKVKKFRAFRFRKLEKNKFRVLFCRGEVRGKAKKSH